MEQALIPMPGYARVIAFYRFKLPRPEALWMKDVGPRSRALLTRLSERPGSLRFWLAVRDLQRESELLWDEAAVDPDGLALQVKALELATEYKPLADLFGLMAMQISMGIVSNIILNCVERGCDAARVRNTGGEFAPIEFMVGDEWTKVGQVPVERWLSCLGASYLHAEATHLLNRYTRLPVPPAQFRFEGSPVNEIVIRPKAA